MKKLLVVVLSLIATNVIAQQPGGKGEVRNAATNAQWSGFKNDAGRLHKEKYVYPVETSTDITDEENDIYYSPTPTTEFNFILTNHTYQDSPGLYTIAGDFKKIEDGVQLETPICSFQENLNTNADGLVRKCGQYIAYVALNRDNSAITVVARLYDYKLKEKETLKDIEPLVINDRIPAVYTSPLLIVKNLYRFGVMSKGNLGTIPDEE
jgi:hypothetical protein